MGFIGVQPATVPLSVNDVPDLPATKITSGTFPALNGSNLTGITAGESNTPSFSALLSSSQTVSHNSLTKILFNTEINDSDSAYDNSSNYRFTVPSGKAGLYAIGYQLYSNGNADVSEFIARLLVNGANNTAGKSNINQINENSQTNYNYAQHTQQLVQLAVGDYVEVYASLYSIGGTSSTLSFNGDTFFKSWFYGYRIHA